MLTHKLVNLVQYHSDTLAAGLLRRVQMSERAGSYRNVPPVELKERVYEIYHHLGTWLLNKKGSQVEQHYMTIGNRRAEQDVALSELVWVIVLTKHNLLEFIDDASFPGKTAEESEKQELLQRLDRFFDQAIYGAVVGYEGATQKRAHASPATAKSKKSLPKAS